VRNEVLKMLLIVFMIKNVIFFKKNANKEQTIPSSSEPIFRLSLTVDKTHFMIFKAKNKKTVRPVMPLKSTVKILVK